MPYAANPLDGVRSYFEEWGGDGAPVLGYAGLADPIAAAQQTGLVHALHEDHRMVFADHRGHGRSDKPTEVAAYSLPTRVADVEAVLDELGIDRVHVLGFSWGARLGYAIGEHLPERALSLVLCGNQPYAWDQRWSFVPTLTKAFSTAAVHGMQSFIDTIEALFDDTVQEPVRSWMLDNDPVALAAAWRSSMAEG